MSWFGGGKKEEEGHQEKGFLDSADSSFSAGSVDASSLGGGGGGMGGGLSEFQQFSMAIQEQMVVQQAITDLSDRSFIKCVTSSMKDSQLSGREVACIHAVTNKWLDSNQYMVGRLAKKQQQAQSGAQSFS